MVAIEEIEREAREVSIFGGPAKVIACYHAHLDKAAADTNKAYRERNELAACLATLTLHGMVEGATTWRGVDENEPDWPVLYIELPSGQQVSYHFSPADAHLISHIREQGSHPWEIWDGSTSEDRSRRLASPMKVVS